MRTHLRPTTALLAGLALLVAACGGEDAEEAPEPDQSVEETDVDGVDADADAEAEEPADEAADEEGDDLLAGITFDLQPLRIDYRVEMDQEGAPESVTIAMDADRVATYLTMQGMESATFIEDGSMVASCFDEGGGWACMSQDIGDAPGGEDLELFEEHTVDETELRDHVRDPYEEQIAGRDAVCGVSSDVGAEGEGEICFDRATGALLRMDVEDGAGGRMFMEATDVTDATEDDFTPPAEVQSLGA